MARDKKKIPVQLSINNLNFNNLKIFFVIVTDLSEQKHNEEIKQFNKTLENRVIERTVELDKANSQLQCELKERKQAEQELELQAVISQNIAEGVCLVRVADSTIVYTNTKFETIFGYEPGELIGKHVSILNYNEEHTNARDVVCQISEAILQHGKVTYEVNTVKKDGTQFWCKATTSTFNHSDYGTVLVAVQQDITEQKIVERKIIASLKEKEVLLKEIHHRVKNNLQIVSSLLQMQARRTQDKSATLVLQDSQNRIASIALVHEKLYRCSRVG
ncbi:PAS domain S-box protein [Coleofasciculus sp. LEGE 07092]|nr:PAS domain S-box protein [Coleofasciculus sp. LEGE 07081]MBE9151984.1 PAS domain S-box protein [Coleofasciculus sp. LEGE 07092]